MSPLETHHHKSFKFCHGGHQSLELGEKHLPFDDGLKKFLAGKRFVRERGIKEGARGRLSAACGPFKGEGPRQERRPERERAHGQRQTDATPRKSARAFFHATVARLRGGETRTAAADEAVAPRTRATLRSSAAAAHAAGTDAAAVAETWRPRNPFWNPSDVCLAPAAEPQCAALPGSGCPQLLFQARAPLLPRLPRFKI